MKQLQDSVGWNVAILTVLSISLSGCGESVNSNDYHDILDQTGVSASEAGDGAAASLTATDASTNTKPAALVVSEHPDTADTALPNQIPQSKTPATDSAADQTTASAGDATTDPTGDAATGKTPAEIQTPVEQTGVKAVDASGSPDAAVDPKAEKVAEPSNDPKTKKPQPRIVTLLIPDKKFKAEGEGAEKALRVSFDDFDLLKVLNMDPVTDDAPSRMPKWLKQLDGKRVRVRGFMYPPFEDTGIRGFTLARDNQICCFGRNPLVYDLVDIFMRKGETTDYIQNRPFDVVGIFRIGDSIAPGELYSMDDAIVIDR
jgi:hypothetical protein